MDAWLIWSLVLFVVGLMIVAVEVFLPSGGLLGIAAGMCLIASLACAFQLDGKTWLILAGVEAVCVPSVIVAAFKILPKTSFGRHLFLGPPAQSGNRQARVNRPADAGDSDLASLNGREGTVVTPLRPSGTAEFEGRRISVVSDGVSIETGARVRVTEVEGNRVVVEAADA